MAAKCSQSANLALADLAVVTERHHCFFETTQNFYKHNEWVFLISIEFTDDLQTNTVGLETLLK